MLLSETELETQAVTSFDGLVALCAEWAELFASAPGATPFQSPAWLVPWWRWFGSGDLHVVCVRAGDRLVGLAPWYVMCDADARRLLPVGVSTSDYLDILVHPDHRAAVGAELAHWLSRHAEIWQTCDFQQLPTGAELLAVPPPAGCVSRSTVQDFCPRVELPHRFDDLLADLRPAWRRRLAYDRRRLERLGEVRFEPANVENLEELLAAWFEMHQARWNQQGLPGVLNDAQVRAFHAESAAALLDAGLLRMCVLRLAGRVVAAWHGFHHRGVTYYYLGGFDPGLARYGVGNLMVSEAIRAAIAEGANSFDFLRGKEAYKYQWGSIDRHNVRRVIERGGSQA